MKNISAKKKEKAYFIDWLSIIAIFIVSSSLLMLLWDFFCFEFINADIAYNIIFYGCLIFSVLIYPIFKDLIFDCGSIGCKILKIKIVDENGNKPTKKQLMLRGTFFHLFWIDYFVSKKSTDYCSLADKITKTKQVYLSDDNI